MFWQVFWASQKWCFWNTCVKPTLLVCFSAIDNYFVFESLVMSKKNLYILQVKKSLQKFITQVVAGQKVSQTIAIPCFNTLIELNDDPYAIVFKCRKKVAKHNIWALLKVILACLTVGLGFYDQGGNLWNFFFYVLILFPVIYQKAFVFCLRPIDTTF